MPFTTTRYLAAVIVSSALTLYRLTNAVLALCMCMHMLYNTQQMTQTEMQRTGQHRGSSSNASGSSSGGGRTDLEFGAGAPGMLPHQMLQV
jgi:uncharacterized membrane protein YgcG